MCCWHLFFQRSDDLSDSVGSTGYSLPQQLTARTWKVKFAWRFTQPLRWTVGRCLLDFKIEPGRLQIDWNPSSQDLWGQICVWLEATWTIQIQLCTDGVYKATDSTIWFQHLGGRPVKNEGTKKSHENHYAHSQKSSAQLPITFGLEILISW